MDESDEDQFALENESMDEVHDVDGELVDSEGEGASPTKPQGPASKRRPQYGSDCDGDESDASEDFDGGSSSSGSSSEDESHNAEANDTRIPRPDDFHTRRRRGGSDREDESDDDDEPPEIPGSPMRTGTADTGAGGRMNRLSELDISNCGEASRQHKKNQNGAPSADIFTISHKSNSSDEEEDDDYETKETEAPRAMEFHSSSSSSDSEHDGFGDEDEDVEENNQQEQRYHGQGPAIHQHQRQDRPKTAAKDLEPYRELVPKAYYETLVQDTPATKATATKTTKPGGGTTNLPTPSKFKVRVPREIEDLFDLVGAFKPDNMDIPVRLEPFIPEYVPAIGVPFDGIQIPRPDGKRDEAGVGFVRESCAHSNAAELELLLASTAKKKQKKRQDDSVERVHSIEDAAHRPREIDQWIMSVAKVQTTKPPPQVIYKKPMPSLASLMELWSEEFEAYLATQPPIPVSRLDVSLPELIRIVCGVVDIPVYEGLTVHSLHLLFSLYHEVIMYEKEMLRNTR